MARLTKSGARKPVAANTHPIPGLSYDSDAREYLHTVSIRGDDGKYYELGITPNEMLYLISVWIRDAASNHSLGPKPKAAP
jgi:hypothetical protein